MSNRTGKSVTANGRELSPRKASMRKTQEQFSAIAKKSVYTIKSKDSILQGTSQNPFVIPLLISSRQLASIRGLIV